MDHSVSSSKKKAGILGQWQWLANGKDIDGDFILNPFNVVTHI